MSRLPAGVLLVLLAAAAAPGAAPPPVPRNLTAQEHKEVATLEARLQRHTSAGEFAQAARVAEQIATFRAQRQGARHWQVIDARFRVANWQRLAKVSVGDRPAVVRARALNAEGVSLVSRDRGREAEKSSREALAIHHKVLGEQHPDTAQGYHNVAFCLARQGKHGEALTLLQRALAVRRQALGEHHPDTAASYNSVASYLDRQGKYGEALTLFRRALAIRRQALGEHHPSTATAYSNVADCLGRQGRNSEALTLLQRALAVRLAVLGEEHADTVQAYQNVATCLDLQGKHHEAMPLFQRALAVSRKVRGEAHPGTAQGYHNVATCLDRQGRYGEALILFRRALAISRQALGEQHPDTAHSDNTLPARVYATLTDPSGTGTLRAALYRQRLAPLGRHLKGVKHLLVVPTGALARVPVEALSDRWTVSYVPSGSAFARAAERPPRARRTSALVLADPAFTATPPRYPPAPPRGLLVKAVVAGSLAARVGLRPGDVLLEHAGKTLEAPDDLKAGTGDSVVIKLWRDGQTQGGRIPAGNLGVVVAQGPLRQALAAWRAEEHKLFASTRGQGWQALPGTRLEARALAGLLPSATLLLGSAASEQALEELATFGKLRHIGLLHLATHGEANPSRPLDTALILAQDRLPQPKEQEARVLAGKKPLEGRLTVDHILCHWQLDADLVTLSACQSGLGADTNGEGLLGFAQAMLQKGARSVVLSRWKVDDTATALLMVRFYENFLGKRQGSKPLPRALALHEAKRWLRGLTRQELGPLVAGLAGGALRGTETDSLPLAKGKAPRLPAGDRPYAHPYYWAAFVLIGDPR